MGWRSFVRCSRRGNAIWLYAGAAITVLLLIAK